MIYGVGLAVTWAVVIFRERLFGVFFGNSEKKGRPHKRNEDDTERIHKRRDDEMMNRFLDAFEESARAQAAIAQALKHNGDLLEKIGEGFQVFAAEIREALTDIHRRIDGLYKNGRHE